MNLKSVFNLLWFLANFLWLSYLCRMEFDSAAILAACAVSLLFLRRLEEKIDKILKGESK